MTSFFFKPKLNTIIARIWKCFLKVKGLKRVLFGKSRAAIGRQDPQPVEFNITTEQNDLYVEQIYIEKMKFRRKSKNKGMYRNMYVKHFKNIPMADMEIVLPEKKMPGLTPVDWVKFFASTVVGLVAVVGSLKNPKTDIRVIFAIVSSVVGYCVKTYFTFQKNLVSYQNLITRTVYGKQLDSGRGTLLHLCDEVIQQEIKEVILSFFMLMERGKATREELDRQCEQFIKEEFNEDCNFDVDDAVQKLEKLGIVTQDTDGIYTCVDLKRANDIIGTTTEEVVLKANGGFTNIEDAEMRRQNSESSDEMVMQADHYLDLML